MQRFIRFCLFLLIVVTLSSCGDFSLGPGEPTDRGNPPPPPCGQSWTILVFLNAANDLDEFSDLNIHQMVEATTNPFVQIVVQWKRIARFAPPGSWTGTRRYLIRAHPDPDKRLQLVQDLGQNVDMGRAETLKEFVQWAKQSYPANRYVLVIWDHGSGWRTRLGKPITRGVSFDDETGHHIKTWELPSAIRPTETASPLDLLVFDASLMQMLEVAYECRNAARYIVGSEESPPGEGYPYHRILQPLAQNPNRSPAEFAKTIVERTIAYYTTNSNITQSALDAAQLEPVATALDALAQKLFSKRFLYATQLARARQRAQSYSSYPEYKDLWHVADLIRQETGDPELGTLVGNLHHTIRQAVLAEAHGQRGVENSHGVSIYYPGPDEFTYSYRNLALAQATRWDEWLQVAP